MHQVSRRALSRCIVWSVLTVSVTCADAVAQEPSDDSQWTFDAAVYGWLMATQGTLGLKGFDADIDNSFADTLKASDSGGDRVINVRRASATDQSRRAIAARTFHA